MAFWKAAANITLRDSGGTFTNTGLPIRLSDGYMVGGVVPTRKLTLARESTATIEAELEHFARENLAADSEGLYLGTWVDLGALYIDVSEWVTDYAEAMELAATRGELAIWDNAAQAAIELTPA